MKYTLYRILQCLLAVASGYALGWLASESGLIYALVRALSRVQGTL